MYAADAQLQGWLSWPVRSSTDFELVEQPLLAAIRQHNPAIVYLAYPNNPTGNLWNAATMARIICLQAGRVGWL